MKRLDYSGAISNMKRGLLILGAAAFLAMLNPATSLAANTATAVQQAKVKVKGTVTDQTKSPVIGASVSIKGSTTGMMTDIDGKFSLDVPAGSTLTISGIGFKPQTVKVTQATTINIVLENDNVSLEQVVVVGYGSQKKGNLTGAVASIDLNKTLQGRPVADIGRGLQGTTSGLSVTIPSAEVGSDPTIKIRGQFASINGSSAPLILLDNVEIPSIQLVNPDDIESISVLKDAASASIYGAKAAFGVILITTKKGAKQDVVNVSYSGSASWQNAAKDYNMGGIDALEYNWRAAKNEIQVKTGAFYKLTEEGLAKAKEWQATYGGKIGANDPTVFGRDWYVDVVKNEKIGLRTYDGYDYMIKKWAPAQSHNLSVNGKSGSTTYNIGLGYLDQEGMNKVAKRDDFERYNSSIKLTSQYNKYITFNAGAIYSKRTKSYPFTSINNIDPWYYLYRWGPQYAMGYDENGKELRSPASEYRQANTATQERNYTNVNVGAHLTFTSNWTADFDYTHANEEYNWLRPGMRFSGADTWGAATARLDAAGQPVFVNSAGAVVTSTTPGAIKAHDLVYRTYTGVGTTTDVINRQSINSQRNTINAFTTYNLKLNDDHAFKFMAGMNRVAYAETGHWGQIASLLDYENVQFGNAIGTQTAGAPVGGIPNWESQLGFFGRVNYSLMDKYLLEANLRYDGSSKFPTDLRWRLFPSFSAGWRASEEAFMEWSKPVLSSLKFRASYGVIGDQTVSNSLYTSTLGGVNQSSWLDANGNKLNQVYAPTAVGTDITWQDIATLDIGVDGRILNNELGFTFDWYQRDTKNMLVPAEGVPSTFGTVAPTGNYGNLRTQGWELSVDYNHRFANGLAINANATLSDAITEVTEYGSSKAFSGWYNGKTYGEIWGYRTARLYQKDDFEYDANGKLIPIVLTAANGAQNAGKTANKLKGANPIYQAYLQNNNFMFSPGDVMFKDLNGDGQITYGDGTTTNPGDKEVIGNSTPRYEYGFRFGADYMGIDFSIFFQGVGKRDMWGNSPTTLAGYNTSDGAIASRFCSDYWTEENPNAFYPRPWNMYNVPGLTDIYNMRPQDRYLLDMSYLRIKNITVGYTMPAFVSKKVSIQKARVYMSLENAYTWDHLDGMPVDPEIVAGQGLLSTTTSQYQSGRAGISTPAFKTFSVGVQLNF